MRLIIGREFHFCKYLSEAKRFDPKSTGSRSKIKSAEDAINRARDQIDSKKAENYGRPIDLFQRLVERKFTTFDPLIGFASMGAVPYAHIVAKMLEGKSKNGAVITLAPNPKDIVSSPKH